MPSFHSQIGSFQEQLYCDSFSHLSVLQQTWGSEMVSLKMEIGFLGNWRQVAITKSTKEMYDFGRFL